MCTKYRPYACSPKFMKLFGENSKSFSELGNNALVTLVLKDCLLSIMKLKLLEIGTKIMLLHTVECCIFLQEYIFKLLHAHVCFQYLSLQNVMYRHSSNFY
jgi:hypothetical protein